MFLDLSTVFMKAMHDLMSTFLALCSRRPW